MAERARAAVDFHTQSAEDEAERRQVRHLQGLLEEKNLLRQKISPPIDDKLIARQNPTNMVCLLCIRIGDLLPQVCCTPHPNPSFADMGPESS